MLNFTGTTRKRVVNLGENRGGNKGRSFLEQAKTDRQQRELGRLREKRAITLQLYIRRLLALRHAASELSNDWIGLHVEDDPSRWCTIASFIIRYGSRTLLFDTYRTVENGIDCLSGVLTSAQVALLTNALKLGLTRNAFSDLSIKCLLKLFSLHDVPTNTPSVLKSLIENLQKRATPKNMCDVVELIFQVNLADSLEAFLTFLANVPHDALHASEQHSKIVQMCISCDMALATVQRLSGNEQLSLLLSVMKLNQSHLTTNDFMTHARILSQMSTTYVSETKEETHPTKFSPLSVVLSARDTELLLPLLSSQYLRQTFHCLRLVNASLCARTMFQLLHLFPQSRTSLCMIMSIIPGLLNWLYHSLAEHPDYFAYLSAERKAEMYVPQDHFLNETERVSFGMLVYTYNQILSSWLVVSKDTESFKGNYFPMSDIKTYCIFLKSFCYSLVRSSRGGHSTSHDLKEISITLLNQLYIKNLRLQFLPQLVWKIKGLELHLEDLILELKDDEYLDSSDDELSEEGGEVQSSSNSRFSFGLQYSFEREILNKVPFFVDFTTRVKIFQNSIQADKAKLQLNSGFSFFSEDLNLHKLSADISRDTLLEDAFENFFKLGSTFKNQLNVTFYNKHGPEAGIDGGGLTKEFLTSVVEEGFSPNNELSLFKESSSCSLYPNDDIFWNTVQHIELATQRKRLMYLNFLGMIIGKCLYEEILIDVSFVPSFLSKWRVAQNNLKNSIDDLVFLDPELYTNLNKLLDMNDDQLQDLDLNFTIDEVIGTKSYLFDLLPPNGALESVTQANRLSYIHKVSHFKLNQSLHLQTKQFLEGLFQLIRPSWLNMFDPLELQMLISGGHDIDLNDWKSNVRYGGYFDDDITIGLFWQVIEEMTPQERCDLVKFVTSVSRAPLLGFGAMYPKFGINNGGSPERLPTASTCVNLLKLPDYKDKALIRQKLLYSIYANSGFDLS